jgi:hypothetical protein
VKRLLNVKRLLAAAAVLACAAGGAVAHGAMLTADNLILTADGSFAPRKLPRRAYAPVDFRGWANVKAVDGGIPPALKQIVLDFDHDGRLSTRGLPVCDPALLEETSPEEARERCRGAIVGTGHLGALIAPIGGGDPVAASSLLTLFNGPQQEGHPTAILQARTTVPAVQTYVLTIPITRRRGNFRYRAVLDVPPILGGRGAITHIDVVVGRRYRAGGGMRSYVSARCSDGILATNGRFTFDDGEAGELLVESSVEKACRAR